VMAVSINIFANLILIPRSIFGFKLFGLGVTGAAIGFLLAALFSYIAFKEYYRLQNGVRTPSSFYLQIIPAAGQSLFLIWAYIYLKPFDILLLLPTVLTSFLIYLIISIALKEITIPEIREILIGLKIMKQKEGKE
ncbi:MAG: hypothetical protein ACYDDC_06555, partial [Thermoplasmataceae archaeon]